MHFYGEQIILFFKKLLLEIRFVYPQEGFEEERKFIIINIC